MCANLGNHCSISDVLLVNMPGQATEDSPNPKTLIATWKPPLGSWVQQGSASLDVVTGSESKEVCLSQKQTTKKALISNTRVSGLASQLQFLTTRTLRQ